MKTFTLAFLLAMLGVVTARPDAFAGSRRHVPIRSSARFKREVPQEHSHEQFLTGVGTALNLNNVDKVQDPVFALLGNAAAAAGAGNVKDLDCLQQRVADQAFTNAKAAGDVTGMTNALIFRALERNTGKVGQASALCTEKATNPEIAALKQHQDPASAGAAATNKQIALDLAVQLDSIGADPQKALLSGTFAPGNVGDTTGAGNSCDDPNDKVGCIETQKLRVDDATAAEINQAVAAAKAGGTAGAGAAANGTAATPAATPAAAASPAAAAVAAVASPVAQAGNTGGTTNSGGTTNNTGGTTTSATGGNGANVNAFTGSLGAPPVPVASSASNRPFSVNGDTFINFGAAAQRACDVQKNQCANAANSGQGTVNGGVAACDQQQQACVAANQQASA